MTSYAAAARRNQNLYRNRAGIRIGQISGRTVTIAAIAVLALLYITQVTKTSVFGNKLNTLKAEKQQLLNARQDLEIEAARLQSIQRIESSGAIKGMVPEGSATFAGQR